MDEETLEWDIEDRDSRLESGELTEPIEDPTVVVVGEDE
jgi:hypothetical protein